jgi:hypothetical protein
MIIARIHAGLGNQMFQYAMGRSLSLRTGQPLQLDPYDFKTDTLRQYELDRYNITTPQISSARHLWEKRLHRPRYEPARRALRLLPGAWYHELTVDAACGFDERILQLPGDIYLDGFWQSERYFYSIRQTLLEDFTFKDAATGPNQKILAAITSTNSVAVHIRRGDYVNTTVGLARHGICGLDYYQRALEYIQKRVGNPTFFLFSDEPDWVRANFPNLPGSTIVSHNTGAKSPEDLRLMMHCQHFIIANSSFSWWGAWLGRLKNKLVVAPQHWFKSPELSDKDLVPESWVRI